MTWDHKATSAQHAQVEAIGLPMPFDALVHFDPTRYRDEASSLRRVSLELQARAPDAARVAEAAVAREQVLQVRSIVETMTQYGLG